MFKATQSDNRLSAETNSQLTAILSNTIDFNNSDLVLSEIFQRLPDFTLKCQEQDLIREFGELLSLTSAWKIANGDYMNAIKFYKQLITLFTQHELHLFSWVGSTSEISSSAQTCISQACTVENLPFLSAICECADLDQSRRNLVFEAILQTNPQLLQIYSDLFPSLVEYVSNPPTTANNSQNTKKSNTLFFHKMSEGAKDVHEEVVGYFILLARGQLSLTDPYHPKKWQDGNMNALCSRPHKNIHHFLIDYITSYNNRGSQLTSYLNLLNLKKLPVNDLDTKVIQGFLDFVFLDAKRIVELLMIAGTVFSIPNRYKTVAMKEQVGRYILSLKKTEPLTKRILENATNENTPLGRFFHAKEPTFIPIISKEPSTTTGILGELHTRLSEIPSEIPQTSPFI